MTRELIIECMTCKEECDEEDSCCECAEKQLSEYENQIKIDAYNQALEDFAGKILDWKPQDEEYRNFEDVVNEVKELLRK